jgi:superfamily II DNA or RNA helicase
MTQISRRGESELRLFYTHLGEVPIAKFAWDILEPPEIIDTHAHLDERESVDQLLEGFDPGDTQGGSFVALDAHHFIGPPPLSRYPPEIDHQGRVIPGVPKRIDLLRPLFQAPLLTADVIPSFLPEAPADYILDAARSFFDREALCLADDPGMGKRIAASIAIQDLFQQRLVRRVLILCPEWARRQWAGVFNLWSPSLEFIFVQGEDKTREFGWNSLAHIYLTDFQTFTEDVENKLLAGRGLIFDVIVLAGINGIRYQTKEISSAIKLISAGRRWALTGSLPHDLQTWLFIFGILTPVRVEDAVDLTLPDIKKRFLSFIIRRSKADLADVLPRQRRHEVWLDLDHRQTQAYQDALTAERDRLSNLGGAVTHTDVMTTINRLKRVSNFAPDWLGGIKIRALVDLVEDLSSSGAKVVVFSQFIEEGLDQLRPALEAYGVLSLHQETPESERAKVLEAFRMDSQWHVLLMEMGTHTDGEPLTEASYVVHFDHSWNPAVRRGAELRLHPSSGREVPLDIYEFWVADTIEEEIYGLLVQRNLLPDLISDDTLPAELEERITLEEWLSEVLDVPPPPEPIPGVEIPITPQVQPPAGEPVEEEILPSQIEGEEEMMIGEVPQPTVELVKGDILLIPTKIEEEESIDAEAPPPPTESPEREILPLLDEAEGEEAVPAKAPSPPAERPEGEILPPLDEDEEGEAVPAEVPPPPTEPPEGEILPPLDEAEEEEAVSAEAPSPPTEPPEEEILPPLDGDEEEEAVSAEAPSPPAEPPEGEILPPLDGDEEKEAVSAEAPSPPTEPEEEKLSELPLEAVINGLIKLMLDQGYPELDAISEPDEGGGEWIAQRTEDDEVKRAYVRLFRLEKNVDIRKARATLEALDTHTDCQLAYLVTTSDFSRSCKKLARESEGELVLIKGDELIEYLSSAEDIDPDRAIDETDGSERSGPSLEELY